MASSKAADLPVEKLSVSDSQVTAQDPNDSSDSGFVTPQTEQSQPSTQPSTQASTALSSETKPDHNEEVKGPIRRPFTQPLASSKPVPKPELTPEQADKYSDLHKLVCSWEKIPVSTQKKAAEEPLSEDERMWLTRECLLRYLRATNWSPANAPKRIIDTLVWRREYKVKEITGDLVSEESETGKQYILGFDINARPCLYMNPGRQNTKKSERQIQHLVFMLDRVIDMMPPGQEMTALLINFRGATGGGSPSVAQGRQVLGILQGHYPERLGRACIAECKFSHYLSCLLLLLKSKLSAMVHQHILQANQPIHRSSHEGENDLQPRSTKTCPTCATRQRFRR